MSLDVERVLGVPYEQLGWAQLLYGETRLPPTTWAANGARRESPNGLAMSLGRKGAVSVVSPQQLELPLCVRGAYLREHTSAGLGRTTMGSVDSK